MAELGAVLQQLRKERVSVERNLRQVVKAIQAVAKVAAGGTSTRGRRRRKLSAAARKKIAAAQRARWAKFHAKAAKRAA